MQAEDEGGGEDGGGGAAVGENGDGRGRGKEEIQGTRIGIAKSQRYGLSITPPLPFFPSAPLSTPSSPT